MHTLRTGMKELVDIGHATIGFARLGDFDATRDGHSHSSTVGTTGATSTFGSFSEVCGTLPAFFAEIVVFSRTSGLELLCFRFVGAGF